MSALRYSIFYLTAFSVDNFTVEFPAVLLNTESGEIDNEFHHYVQPQESPLLSDFCKQLTGITQV